MPSSSPSALRAIALALSDIKIAHSVFALPFAVLATFLCTPLFFAPTASPQAPSPKPHASTLLLQLLLILLCMFLARTWAMLINRLADWKFDRENPRTAKRAIARGDLSPRAALAVALACAALFTAAASLFSVFFRNPWPPILALPVLAWIAFYSFTKRFTALAHVFLGGALAASPIAAALAINPAIFGLPLLFSTPQPSGTGVPPVSPVLTPLFSSPSLTILCLSGMVLFWVAGFDIAYALQDLDFDRRAGLRSIPAKLGVRGSLWTARLFHAAAFAFLIFAYAAEPRFGSLMLNAVAAVGALLVYEHVVLHQRGVAGLPLAFFTLNGFISLTLGVVGCIDVVM